MKNSRRFLLHTGFLCGMVFQAGIYADCLSLDDSARAALDEALPISAETGHEYAGALYVIDGCYSYTPPQTSGEKKDVAITITLPKGAQLAGIYHTHPHSPYAHLFSPNDVAAARALGVPSYIGLVSDSSMRVFEPSKDARRVARNGTYIGKKK